MIVMLYSKVYTYHRRYVGFIEKQLTTCQMSPSISSIPYELMIFIFSCPQGGALALKSTLRGCLFVNQVFIYYHKFIHRIM